MVQMHFFLTDEENFKLQEIRDSFEGIKNRNDTIRKLVRDFKILRGKNE